MQSQEQGTDQGTEQEQKQEQTPLPCVYCTKGKCCKGKSNNCGCQCAGGEQTS